MAKAKVESIFKKKTKKSGKAKKSFGPKSERPKRYQGQGR
jgi:hypothetical protein